MNPRLLNTKVTILRKQPPARDAAGGPVVTYLPVAELPARVVLEAGRDRSSQRRDDHRSEGAIYLDGRPDVRPGDRIGHEGRTFAIVGEPADPHGLGNYLRIEVMRVGT